MKSGQWRWTYNSRPIAGPFGSTSDTTRVVSPLSGLGLSLPPDMANPNPNLGSCNYERLTWKGAFKQRTASAWKSDMNENENVWLYGRSNNQWQTEHIPTVFSLKWDSEEATGCVTMNSSRSVCYETESSEVQSGSSSRRPLSITIGNIKEPFFISIP